MYQLVVNGYNIYCQTARVVQIKCPLERAGKAWGEIEEDGAACGSVRDVGAGEKGGCWCSQTADQRTYIVGSSELSFTVATGMAATEGG